MAGGHPFAIPLALLCAIWISGPITGGHINPAVTIGVYIIRWKDLCRNTGWLFLYWFAQFSGGMFGGWLALLSLNRNSYPGYDFPVLLPTSTEEGAFLTEVICTFVFIFVIMIAKEPRCSANMAGPTPIILITIALALACQVFVAGSHTGGCFNPAVATALSVECAAQCI